MKKKSRTNALLLAFFFSILGIYKFYLGQKLKGLIMLLLTITGVGGIISGIWFFIDFIKLIMMSDVEFDEKYNKEVTNETIG